jgi:hypothetical protein
MVRQAGYIAMSLKSSMPAWLRRRGSTTEDEKKAIEQGRIAANWKAEAGQAAVQGSRRALDGQIHQGQTAPGWLNAASRSGNPAIWLSEPCFDRSPFRLHPLTGGHLPTDRRPTRRS